MLVWVLKGPLHYSWSEIDDFKLNNTSYKNMLLWIYGNELLNDRCNSGSEIGFIILSKTILVAKIC